MKILLLNYEFPPIGGGAGKATSNLARELARAGQGRPSGGCAHIQNKRSARKRDNSWIYLIPCDELA